MSSDDGKDPPTERYPDRADDATLVPRLPDVAGTMLVDDATRAAGAYAFGEMIGRGGMGEVLLAHDRRIGRDVALKRLHAGAPSEQDVRRFLREARIQARLEHPAIVPVYELSRDEAGRPFFTMKRIVGVTLGELLAKSAASRQRLLRAFAEVCRAIDYAHSRGIVHRDLKPSNIVLGEFGEVYVIDWGIARVVGDAAGSVETADVDLLDAARTADVIGTPGYSSPEQLRAPDVDRPADVYSLGAILFELLAGEPLHPRGLAAIANTLEDKGELAPSARRPDRNIPPELDRLCAAMLAATPSGRPTARRCAEQIEEFLDGDRDVARRRVLARDLVALAREAHRGRRPGEAMRAASRALALDPEAKDAAELVMHIMLQPPAELSPEVRALLAQYDDQAVSRHARAAMPGYIMIAGFLPIIVWNGVRSWPVTLAMTGLAVLLAFAAWDLVRHPRKSLAHMVVYAIANSLLFAVMGRMISPLVVVPAFFAFTTGSVVTYPAFLVRKWLLIGIMVGGFLLPLCLEAVGVLSSTFETNDAGLLVFGNGMHVRGAPTVITVLLGAIAVLVMAGLQSARISNASRAAHHRLVLHAHQLAQLLPLTSRS
jgi:serine/threonine-protein kinase